MVVRRTLVVTESAVRRRALTQVIKQSLLYDEIRLARTISRGIEHLSSGRFDTVFLGSELGCQAVATFYEALQGTLTNEQSHCVLIVGEEDPLGSP